MSHSSSETSSSRVDPALAAGNRRPLAGYAAKHFAWSVSEGVGRRVHPVGRLSRPSKNLNASFPVKLRRGYHPGYYEPGFGR